MNNTRSEKIAALNDAFRTTFEGGTVVVTRGVAEFAEETKGLMAEIASKVRSFSEFTPDNDPNGAHDFGAVNIVGQKLFWKIDYYDKSLGAGSSDPANPDITQRVLTILLAEER